MRIPAREVILATRAPEGLSLHNVLPGTVSAIHADPAFDHVIVQIAVGGVLLLAEVTRDADRATPAWRGHGGPRADQVRLVDLVAAWPRERRGLAASMSELD